MLCEDYNFKVNVKELIFDYLDIWEKEKTDQNNNWCALSRK